MTQVRNLDAIERAGLREGVDSAAIDSEAVTGRLHGLGELLRGSAGGVGPP